MEQASPETLARYVQCVDEQNLHAAYMCKGNNYHTQSIDVQDVYLSETDRYQDRDPRRQERDVHRSRDRTRDLRRHLAEFALLKVFSRILLLLFN